MVILGSTGSIGQNALLLCKDHKIGVEALSCGRNFKLLNDQILKFSPKFVCIGDPNLAKFVNHDKVFTAQDGLMEMLELCKSKIVLNALVGFAGLRPSLQVQRLNKTLALANKESLVVAGKFLDCQKIIPVDSEHFGLNFLKNSPSKIKNLILTASGGAFYKTALKNLKFATAKNALKHPNWDMGSKITIDSATMANKLFEILEAFWLYGTKNIDALIESKSLVHALIEFEDGSTTAHLSKPDMKLAIAHAILQNPQKITPNLDLKTLCNLSLKPINLKKYPIFSLKDKILQNPNLGVVINATNEVMVNKFLKNECGFLDISKVVLEFAKSFENIQISSLDEIFEIDKEIRCKTRKFTI